MMRAPNLAAWLAAAALSAAPLAQAGDVVKCVDGGGHATFTDQPCPSGSASLKLSADGAAAQGGMGGTASTGASEPEPPAAAAAALPAIAPQRHVLPAADLRHDAWRRPAVASAAARPAPLRGDVATLKAAHRTLLQQEGARASLAGIE